MIPESQREVAAFLGRLTGATPVETHISAVFVGPDQALKLKKAVTLSFLDFAPLDARRHFALRELELNRPAAPGIYRDVVAVTREADGRLALGGRGEPVEWVLRMAPVPEADFLDAVAARGPLPAPLLDAVADTAVALQAAAPVVEGSDSPATLRIIIEGNLPSCRAAGLPEERVQAWLARSLALLDHQVPLLRRRAAAGFVRRCHGDLHLGNLCLWEGRPTAFDALEFDETLTTIDVGYDLAFLLMDLDRRQSRAAANRVLNRVLARTGDYAMLAPLPIWLSLRAMIRAHIEARRDRPWQDYLAAAEAYLAPPPPVLVAIGGLQGTGKSTLARALAPGLGAAPGALLLRTDELRKRRFRVAPETRLPLEAYAPEVSAAVHAELFAAAGDALGAGQAVILDAVFLDPVQRTAAEGVAKAAGVPFAGLWLEAPLEVLRARLAARAAAGRDASDADASVLDRAATADPGRIAWTRIDATGDAPAAARLALPPGAMC
jgi:aminoglycoside phosphotransferase family enzyme/predicted kinase